MNDTQNKIAVMQAHLEGQPIESLHRPMTSTKWIPCPEPDWSWGIHDYRIAPPPPEPRPPVDLVRRGLEAGLKLGEHCKLNPTAYVREIKEALAYLASGREAVPKATLAAEPEWQYFRKGNEWWRVRDDFLSYRWKPGYSEWSFAGLHSAKDIQEQGWAPCDGFRYFDSRAGNLRRVPVGAPPETKSENFTGADKWAPSDYTLAYLLGDSHWFTEIEKP